MCNHKWMAFGVDANGNYRVCSKCGKKVYIITNADRIRVMNNEELAEFLVHNNKDINVDDVLDWLRQPADQQN